MIIYLIALLAGFLAGLRTFFPLALISWLAYFGWLGAPDSWLRYLANAWAVGILTILMLVELVIDQLPSTPSRKVPVGSAHGLFQEPSPAQQSLQASLGFLQELSEQ